MESYQGVLGVATSTSSTVAGVALLPNTGETPILMYVAVAAIVTGVTATVLQIVANVYRRSNR